jgi:hypothetical protein
LTPATGRKAALLLVACLAVMAAAAMAMAAAALAFLRRHE